MVLIINILMEEKDEIRCSVNLSYNFFKPLKYYLFSSFL